MRELFKSEMQMLHKHIGVEPEVAREHRRISMHPAARKLRSEAALVDHDPAHVCPHESFFDRVRIFLFVGLEMVSTVITAPFDG